jgi:hypothetical protein
MSATSGEGIACVAECVTAAGSRSRAATATRWPFVERLDHVLLTVRSATGCGARVRTAEKSSSSKAHNSPFLGGGRPASMAIPASSACPQPQPRCGRHTNTLW